MPIVEIVFYLFGGVLVASALCVITARNPVYSVLFLVLSFFSAACIWLLLVYVGAVMVLFLFVVMMLDINLIKLKAGFIRYLPVGVLVALAMAAQLFIVIWTRGLESQVLVYDLEANESSTRALGEWLFTRYLYPFEIAGIILLVAIVAAIALTHRRRPETKYQDPSVQVKIKRDERIRLVKVEAEAEQEEK